MKIEIVKYAGFNIPIVNIVGSIKSGMEFDLAYSLESLIINNENPIIILNMKEVPSINAAAIGIFLNIYKEVNKLSGRMIFCSLSIDVDNIFEVAQSIIEGSIDA